MLKFRKSKLLILFLLLFLLLGASFVLAQKPLEITYPQIPGAVTPTTAKTALPDYIRYVFQFSLFLGALIALGSFIYGGVRYLTSAGSPSAQKDAKSQISGGILGLIILISAYLILNTLNPQLVAWEVSLLPGAPTARPVAGLPKPEPTAYVEIPLGGLVENLWGKRETLPHRPADCYQFNSNGDATNFLEKQERLDCVQWLSKAIQVKAKKLKEPIEELQKLYNCQNCCRDCCKNPCDWTDCSEVCDWNEESGQWENCWIHICCEGTGQKGCWENCGAYTCCEGRGMEHQYYYQECPYSCCEYFETCLCTECEGCICVRPDGKCCNPEDPTKHYEDPAVEDLIEKIKPALKELRLKLGLFPITEELGKLENIDTLLESEETKNLIKEILIGEPVDEEKLKEILKIKSAMKYLVESDLLSTDKNLAKTMMRNLDLLRNEVAINEIGWMGTQAGPNDEWIELYNNTKENIDFTSWKLVVEDKFEINLSGGIPAQGFYLLGNNQEVISDVEANLIYSGNLADSGEKLELYDEFGNLVEVVDCTTGWFAGDKNLKTSMERINPKEESSDRENWATNLSIRVEEEMKEDYINGEDRNGNPIYGTPKSPNSAGVDIIPYPSFNSLVVELRDKLRNEEGQREKLILVLRQDENLERMLKSKEALKDILVGDDWRLKTLLSQREVLRILIEDEDNLNLLLADAHAKEVIRDILGIKEEGEWEELLADLEEARINLKLINDFTQDLLWVLDAADLMRGCEEDPISYDQFRVPELGRQKIEKVPEWEDVEIESRVLEGLDPAIFYCHKPLW